MISKLENDFLIVEVNTFGAELESVTNKHEHEFMHKRDELWNRTNPVLFPFCGAQKDNEFYIDGKRYNGLRHGFARDCEFELVESTKNSLSYLLDSKDHYLAFPYKYNFYVNYKLDGRELLIEYKIDNLDDKTIYFGVGAHVGFNIDYDNFDMNDFYFEFNREEKAYQLMGEDGLVSDNKKLILQGKKIKIDEHLFDNDSIMLKGLKSHTVSLKNSNSKYSVYVSFPKDSYILLWAPAGKSNFVCIEPWQSPNAFKNSPKEISEMKDLVHLPEGETFSYRYSIEFDD